MAKQPNPPVRATSEAQEVKVKPKMDPVADLLGSGRIVSYKADFAHLTGSITAGLLLSQFWYFSSLPTAIHRDGWFYLTMDEISEQTGMIREEQVTARERLKDLGILEEKRQGVPAQLWFRLDKERLYELLREYAARKEALLQDAGIPQSGKATRQSAGIPQSVVREFRRLVRGIVTGKSAGTAESITKDFSESSSIEFSGNETDPPINPPMGENANDTNAGGSIVTAIGNDTQVSQPDATAQHSEVWSSVLSRLEKPIRLPLKLIDLTETTATLATNDSWARNWLEDHKGEVLAAAFREVLGVGESFSVRFAKAGKGEGGE